MKRIKKYFHWSSGCCAAWTLAALLVGCQDSMTDGASSSADAASQQEIAFKANVVSSKMITRADNTIINKGTTSLLATSVSNKQVGIFGGYTGEYHWLQLAKLADAVSDDDITESEFLELKALSNFSSYANAAALQAAAPDILKKYYTPNAMYNEAAVIEDFVNGSNALTYRPIHFWPNQEHTENASQVYDYMTFWAYYPYNTTSSMGTYGIAITQDQMGEGKGMGSVKFTMHPDASQQNDFLISAPVIDRNRSTNPLIRQNNTPEYEPQPVQFRLYHMLAQVRFYAFINGDDKMVYQADKCTQAMLDTWNDGTKKFTDTHLDTEATKKYFRKSDGFTSTVPVGGWLQVGDVVNNVTITEGNIATYADLKPAVMNELGTWVELKVGDQIPDESQCVRWERSNVWNLSHTSRRPNITYTMELNNIRTTATFYPKYNADGTMNIDYSEPTALGSATINHYIMNPYWFTFKDGLRERLNDNYMFGYFEDTPVAKGYNATDASTLSAAITAASASDSYDDYDGWNWTGLDDPLDYIRSLNEETPADKKILDELKGLGVNSSKHYNFAPGNILLVVPQTLSDDEVPHVIITAKGKTSINGVDQGETTARVTVNLLKMGISWESGYIYCYAFLDNLHPGDDKVRGPESITVLFNTNWYTDQW